MYKVQRKLTQRTECSIYKYDRVLRAESKLIAFRFFIGRIDG